MPSDTVWYPRSMGNKEDSSAGTIPNVKIFVAGAKMKVAIAQGGVSKSFRFLVYLTDE